MTACRHNKSAAYEVTDSLPRGRYSPCMCAGGGGSPPGWGAEVPSLLFPDHSGTHLMLSVEFLMTRRLLPVNTRLPSVCWTRHHVTSRDARWDDIQQTVCILDDVGQGM